MKKLTEKEIEDRVVIKIIRKIQALEKRFHQSLVQKACNRYVTVNREQTKAHREMKEELKKLDLKTELEITKELLRTFDEAEHPMSLANAENRKEIGVADNTNAVMIISKNDEAKFILRRFKENTDDKEQPKLDYKPENKDETKARFGIDYITKVIRILGITDETIEIRLKKDYPITIENRYFRFVVAPRGDMD